MRQLCWLAAVVGMVGVARAESYSVVQVTDMDHEVTIQAVSTTELKDLKKQIESETRVFQKAKDLAAKEWAARIAEERKANDKNAPKTLPFPASQIRGAREMRVMPRSYMKKDDADKAVQALEELASRKEDSKKEKEIKAGKPLTKKPGDYDKELNLREAATAVKAKIDELTQAGAAGAAGGAAAAGAGNAK